MSVHKNYIQMLHIRRVL